MSEHSEDPETRRNAAISEHRRRVMAYAADMQRMYRMTPEDFRKMRTARRGIRLAGSQARSARREALIAEHGQRVGALLHAIIEARACMASDNGAAAERILDQALDRDGQGLTKETETTFSAFVTLV